MKKILCLMLTLIVAVGVFSACNAKDDFVPSGFKRISADNCGYRLFVPSSWTADLSTGVTTAYVSEQDRSNISFMAFEVDTTIINATIGTPSDTGEQDSSSESASVSSEEETTAAPDSSDTSSAETEEGMPEITTVDEYWEYYSKEFEATFGDMEYEIKGENMLLSAKAAKKYVYTATVTGEQYKFMQVVLLNAGTVYIFTYTALPDAYENHLEDVEKIIGYIDISA